MPMIYPTLFGRIEFNDRPTGDAARQSETIQKLAKLDAAWIIAKHTCERKPRPWYQPCKACDKQAAKMPALPTYHPEKWNYVPSIDTLTKYCGDTATAHRIYGAMLARSNAAEEARKSYRQAA